uniref:N-alpha-acetyltransferase 38, NatC auxiliary subunit n=1 Tax=Chrysemys picta bellii TaxID=8478 RepID=A0A8C3HF83_CHRPI
GAAMAAAAGQREENGCCGRAPVSPQDSDGEAPDSPCARARHKLETLLNRNMRICMTDGRTLVGCFLCTDRDCNVILGSAQEYLKASGAPDAWVPPLGGGRGLGARTPGFSPQLWEGSGGWWLEQWGWEPGLLGSLPGSGRGVGAGG